MAKKNIKEKHQFFDVPHDEMSYCHKHGIKVYPVYQNTLQITNRSGKEVKFYPKNWYIEVDNNGRKYKYDKSVGTGSILKGFQCHEPINNTYKYWHDKLKKAEINGTN